MTEEPGLASAGDVDAPPELTLQARLEALLVTLDRPLVPEDLAEVLEAEAVDVTAALEALAREYEEQGRGFAVRPSASGWRLYAVPGAQKLLAAVVQGEQSVRLSNAALETLAVVAYQQPVSRSRVAAVRGVNVDAVMRTLSLRGLIHDTGVDETTGAVLYGTTALFLDKIGLGSLAELPELAPLLPDLATASDIHDGIST